MHCHIIISGLDGAATAANYLRTPPYTSRALIHLFHVTSTLLATLSSSSSIISAFWCRDLISGFVRSLGASRGIQSSMSREVSQSVGHKNITERMAGNLIKCFLLCSDWLSRFHVILCWRATAVYLIRLVCWWGD